MHTDLQNNHAVSIPSKTIWHILVIPAEGPYWPWWKIIYSNETMPTWRNYTLPIESGSSRRTSVSISWGAYLRQRLFSRIAGTSSWTWESFPSYPRCLVDRSSVLGPAICTFRRPDASDGQRSFQLRRWWRAILFLPYPDLGHVITL